MSAPVLADHAKSAGAFAPLAEMVERLVEVAREVGTALLATARRVWQSMRAWVRHFTAEQHQARFRAQRIARRADRRRLLRMVRQARRS